jgi:hypothetical protein
MQLAIWTGGIVTACVSVDGMASLWIPSGGTRAGDGVLRNAAWLTDHSIEEVL